MNNHMPCHAIPYHTKTYNTIQDYRIPHHITPYNTHLQYHTRPYNTTPHHTIQCHITIHHTTSHHNILQHTTPHHNTPYHTPPHPTPHHTMTNLNIKRINASVVSWHFDSLFWNLNFIKSIMCFANNKHYIHQFSRDWASVLLGIFFGDQIHIHLHIMSQKMHFPDGLRKRNSMALLLAAYCARYATRGKSIPVLWGLVWFDFSVVFEAEGARETRLP